MKKHFFLLIYFLSGLFFTESCKNQGRQNTERPLYLYSLITPEGLSQQTARSLIINFLGEKDPTGIVQSDDKFIYYVSKNDLNTTFEEDLNTGNFTFSRNMNKYMGDYAPKLPSPNQSVEISEAFLKKNQIYPKNGAELKIVHEGGVRSQAVVGGKKGGPIVDKLITLTYGRIMDSLPVLGPGSKLVVNLGDSGEVVGLIHRWREINPGKTRKLEAEEMISREEALELAKKQIATEYGANTTYKINSESMAYYDNNGSILQPVYSFETTINLTETDKNVKPLQYLCIIPILKNSPEPLQLIAVDSKARELIKSGSQNKKDSTAGKDRTRD